MAGTTLLDNISADATGTGICGNQKRLVVYVWATDFGGGTVTIECSPDDGTTWFTCKHAVDNDDASFTAKGCMELQPLGQDAQIRATLSGSTGASGVYAKTLCY